MMLIGVILFAAAVVVVAVVMTQNRSAVLDVHAFGYTWHAHATTLIVFGIVATLVAAAGIRWMQVAALRAALRKTAGSRAATTPGSQAPPAVAEPAMADTVDEHPGRGARTSIWSRSR